ncbi:MAG TPA: large conductance mechanosensitive channel protein MscL [Pyrinomonadaceae bacterium]|jgi:large conductance mechanosensitive channel|nr:large conductance mechanosensitive channel protein MscL [Pyrinomonadaceae bacterium]
MLKEFKEFVARGNVIDLAVGVIIGAAFGKIVTSLVEGLIMPPIGLVLGRIDFASLFIVLDHSKGTPLSLADAKTKGISVLAYGQFLNDFVNFVIIAFVIFLLIKIVNRLRRKDPSTKDCPHCLTAIPVAATRCSGCCADLKAA